MAILQGTLASASSVAYAHPGRILGPVPGVLGPEPSDKSSNPLSMQI